jgi:hypothetical protein
MTRSPAGSLVSPTTSPAISEASQISIRSAKLEDKNMLQYADDVKTPSTAGRRRGSFRREAPHLHALVADGTVRPSEGPRYLPKSAKLRGSGQSAADYISEGRR